MKNLDGLRLRLGLPQDIDAIRELERRSAERFLASEFPEIAGEEPTEPNDLAERIADGRLLVADDGVVAAYVSFRQVDGCGYVEQIDVLPTHAGRRIGAALLEAVAEQARRRGWPALALSTFRDIAWNAPYYRRLGFVDLADEALTPGLRDIRAAHIAKGLDESRRTFMRREL